MVESGQLLKRILVASVVVTMTLTSRVFGLGEFQLVLSNFQNSRGLSSNATCCRGNASTQTQQPPSSIIPVCPVECRTFFRICLSHYQAIIPADPQCTYGLTTTPVLGANSFNLSDASGDAYLVPFQYNFTWTGSFSLVIEAFNDLTSSIPYEGSRRQLLFRLATQRLLTVGPNWTRENLTDDLTRSSLVYEFRVVCESGFYGPGCVRVCAPRDDLFGHYDCNDDGLRVCMNGWTGSYCETAVCLEGCNDTFGLCITPFECRCRYGWQGRTCDECIPYPDCNHGNCVLPYQCNCFDGWEGQLCNIEMPFCARFEPCLNGGSCSNDGVDNYTCRCLPGFLGRQCDIVDDVCRQRPCQNGATCKVTNGSYVCDCPAGFSGVRCESIQTGSLPQGPQQVTQGQQEVTITQHPEESTYSSSASPRSVSSEGHTASTSSASELTWVEITLIVFLGGLLPVLLATSGAIIFAVHKHRRRRDESRVRSNSRRPPCPTVSAHSLALPKMNNVVDKVSSTRLSPISPYLTQHRKVFNVGSNTNFWSDPAGSADQSESKWTRGRLPPPTRAPEIRLFSPEVQGQRIPETWKNVDRVPDILGTNDAMTCTPWTQGNVFIVPGVPRSQRTRPALEYVSVVASWRCYEYPVGSLTTDV